MAHTALASRGEGVRCREPLGTYFRRVLYVLYGFGKAFNEMVGLRDRIYGLLHEGQRFSDAGIAVRSALQLD